MSINPYNNGYNKFTYTLDELNYIDESWNLIDKFSDSYLTKSELREKTILYVATTYSPTEFERLEIIIEKMFWNIINILKKKFKDSYIEQKIFSKEIDSASDILSKQLRKIYKKNKNLSESCINKILVKKNNMLLYKYDYPNIFDMLVTSIISNRITYETIYSKIDVLGIEFIKKLIVGVNFRDNFDYLFPNINTITSFCYTNRIDRVKKYYYENDNSDMNWFIFL